MQYFELRKQVGDKKPEVLNTSGSADDLKLQRDELRKNNTDPSIYYWVTGTPNKPKGK